MQFLAIHSERFLTLNVSLDLVQNAIPTGAFWTFFVLNQE